MVGATSLCKSPLHEPAWTACRAHDYPAFGTPADEPSFGWMRPESLMETGIQPEKIEFGIAESMLLGITRP